MSLRSLWRKRRLAHELREQADASAPHPAAAAAGPDTENPGDVAAFSPDTVRGERWISAVSRHRSWQSRASSVLAGGVSMVLGLGALTWYYANAVSRPARETRRLQAARESRAHGEMALPSLGRIDVPRSEREFASSATVERPSVSHPGAEATRQRLDASPSVATPPLAPASQPSQDVIALASGVVSLSPAPMSPLPPGLPLSPLPAAAGSARSGFDHRLAGAVFVGPSPLQSVPASLPAFSVGADASGPAPGSAAAQPPGRQPDNGMAAWLRPTLTAAAQARVLPTSRFLLAKGAFIDCTLETAIDSTLPGMTTCITATDTFGVDGSVVLLERGTKLVGETRGEVRQGAARLYVLWTEARTPTGVVVPLDSPGTDELGRSGLPGAVNRHFWERFGAAILISTIDGAVQSAFQSSARAPGAVILNPATSRDLLTETLKGTLGIPPTVRKKNGARVQVLVARDVDFRSVYELHAVTTAR